MSDLRGISSGIKWLIETARGTAWNPSRGLFGIPHSHHDRSCDNIVSLGLKRLSQICSLEDARRPNDSLKPPNRQLFDILPQDRLLVWHLSINPIHCGTPWKYVNVTMGEVARSTSFSDSEDNVQYKSLWYQIAHWFGQRSSLKSLSQQRLIRDERWTVNGSIVYSDVDIFAN